MKFNDIVAGVVRSPFHWLMGRETLLISITGRKSGQPVTLPVNFSRAADGLWVISSRDRVWWRNLQANDAATLWISGKTFRARAELVLDETAVRDRLASLIAAKKWFANALHIRLDAQNRPNADDLRKVAQERLFIRLKVES
jgi:deazaflavin-dependent oxidoreductase (nitroreductase family)